MRRTALKRGKPKRRDKDLEWAKATADAFVRSKGRCVVCGGTGEEWHHVLPVRQYPELVNVADNLVPVCRRDHANHEAASRRIQWEELPECAITLAYATSGAAAMFLERTYPR